MNLLDKARAAYKAFNSSQLGNSVEGRVLRNYAKDSEFTPYRQLRGITYKAIDKIGMSLSVYEPKVSKRNGDFYEQHPLYNLFNSPNPIQRNASDFIHLYGMMFEIYGETFWYLVRGQNTKKIMEIYLLNPQQMELKFDEGELIGYVLHKSNGQQIPFTLDEIYHDKRPNPFNEWRGMSVMERAAQYIDIELTTTSFTLNYMRNNASPSGIVSLPQMDKEAFKQFAAQWREGYEGPENAGKTAFIRSGEADFKAVGATLKDVDQKITREMAKEDVLLMLEVPKALLGMTDDKGFGRASVETLNYIFAKEKIEPMMRRLDRIYDQILLMQPSRGESGTVSHVSPIPEDKEFIHSQNKDLVNVALTVNEVRERMNLPPIDGGDELDKQNQVPQTAKIAKKIVLKKKPSKSEVVKAELEVNENFRKTLVETNEVYAGKLKKEIATFAKKQEATVIDKINASSKSFEEWLFEVKSESELLALALVPIIIELIEAQGEDVANFITGELLTISPEMRQVVDSQIKQIAGVFNADTLRELEQTLTEGQAAGESLNKLKKRVEQVYNDASGYRAERIARTESLRNSNMTAELVYKQNGYEEVEWFINPGACEFCRTYAGKTKKIGSNFNTVGDVITGENGGQLRLEYSDIATPPLHPNCTCSLVPSGSRLGA